MKNIDIIKLAEKFNISVYLDSSDGEMDCNIHKLLKFAKALMIEQMKIDADYCELPYDGKINYEYCMGRNDAAEHLRNKIDVELAEDIK